MDMKAFEITTKIMVGEDVTEEEKSYARNYNAKYSIVRHLVMEKLATDKTKETKDFHFTPGEDFMKTPTVDVVNSILKVFSGFPEKFDTSKPFGDPPHTGKPKRNLVSPPASVWEKD